MRNLVRVVYEGHSHHVNHRVSDVDKILHLQGKGNGGAMWGTVLYRVPGGETYVSNVLWDGKNSGELAEDERRSLPESMAYATDQLKSTIQEDLEAPILKLVGLRDHRTSGHSNFLDPAVANMVADAFYWYGKKLSREADNSQKLILTDNGAPISKDRIIGASSYLNTGKFNYDEYMTLAALTDHYPNPEPYAVRRITGQQLTDYIRENLVYWDASGEVVSSFAFSHNLRVIVSRIKTQKQANGKMKVTAENVRLYILTGPEGERKYMPIELDGTYYLGMPHHMMVGLYEASGFANAERYGDFTSIYKEERLSFSDVMEKFFREASVSRAHKLPENTTPRKWYRAQTLPIDVKPDAVPFREYYTVDAEGNRVILDEENLLWDTSRHPYTLVDVGGGRKMRMPVHSIPVFETHAGRILNADNALPFLPDNATLDALYAGEASWGDVFSTPADGGFVQQVSEDTSVLGKAGNFLKNNKTAQVVIGAVALGGAMALMDVLTPGTGVLAASILPFFGISRGTTTNAKMSDGTGAEQGSFRATSTPKAFKLHPSQDTQNIISSKGASIPVLSQEERYALNDYFPLYRGMGLNSLEEAEYILRNGLEPEKVASNAKEIYFVEDLIGVATTFAISNLNNSASIPTLILAKQSAYDMSQERFDSYRAFDSIVPADQIEVLAYLNQENGAGWYHVSMNKAGEMVATPVGKWLDSLFSRSDLNRAESLVSRIMRFYHDNKIVQLVAGSVAVVGIMSMIDVLTPETGILAASVPFFGFHNADDLGPSEEELALLEKENAAKTAYATQFNENLKERLARKAAGIEETVEEALSYEKVTNAPMPRRDELARARGTFVNHFLSRGGKQLFASWRNYVQPNFSNKGVVVPVVARNATPTVYLHKRLDSEKTAPAIDDMPLTPEALRQAYAKDLPKGVNPASAKMTVVVNFSDLHGLPATSVLQVLEAHWEAFGRENVIVLSGGDIATGSYVLNAKSDLGAYILAHTDAAVYGNHEFDMISDYLSNLFALKSINLWSTNMHESRVGSGPAILGHKVRMFKGNINTLPYTVKTTGANERVMIVGLPKAGYGNVFYTQKEEAHASIQESLDAAMNYVANHPVDHIIILAHEALNDHRKESTLSPVIESALAKYPENIRKIIRVVYEGHSHKPQMFVSPTDGILHTQGSSKGEAKNAVVGTVMYRIPGQSTYVSTHLWNSTEKEVAAPVNGSSAGLYKDIEQGYIDELQLSDQPFVLFTEPLVRFKDTPNKGDVKDGYINYHDNSASNLMADAERYAIKAKIRSKDETIGFSLPDIVDDGLADFPIVIDKYHLIGAASKDNAGKPTYQTMIQKAVNGFKEMVLGKMTGDYISEHYPNPEPVSLARTTGLGFVELVKKNIDVIDGKIVPTFYFSHNVRISYDVEIGTRTVTKTEKKVIDGKETDVVREVEEQYPIVNNVYVYMLGYDNKYTPIVEDDVYYIAMPDHMRVGWYEGKNVPFFLDKDPLYVEGTDKMSVTMKNFIESVPVQLAQKHRLHPAHWYEDRLAPYRPVVTDVNNPTNLPVFAPRYGRMLDLQSLPFIPTKAQLDALYSGEVSWGDVFGTTEVGGFVRQLPEDTPVPEVDLSNPLTNN